MIQIKDLLFQYPQGIAPVLEISEFQLKRGERLFLYGPSGCGKTTFLEILAGVNVPQQGIVQVAGQNLQSLKTFARDRFRADHIGYIFQSFNLIPYLSVEENITLPLYLSPRKRQKVSTEVELQKAHELCQSLGLEKYLRRSVTELSVGQQQRVAAARALIGEPELILADEPTSSLDQEHREKFISLLFSLSEKQGSAILFVSHDRTLENLFDRTQSLLEINRASFSTAEEL
jgi:putative ABC transport system ATP-binding protein